MLIYGKNSAISIIEGNQKIKKIYLSESFNDKNIITLLRKHKFSYETKSIREINNLAPGLNQGIIIDIEDYEYYDLETLIESAKTPSFFVILDHIEDPHNLGAIIRTCEAAGVDGVIIPNKRSAQVNSTVMKVSSGALDNIKVCLVSNIVDTMKKLKEKGFWTVGTKMETKQTYYDLDYKMNICLIIGNEGSGISNLVEKECDYMVNIPMVGKINSLNASVATGIIVFEILKKSRE